MKRKPPRYAPATGSTALASRLRALLAGGEPIACPVYVGLGTPLESSTRHAEATHLLARGLANHAVEALPHFNTTPAPITRVLTAASWGRSDAMSVRVDEFPEDLASYLWCQVGALVRDAAQLTHAERRCASTVMLRLGYIHKAAALVGMNTTDPSHFVFSAEYALEELQVLRRTRHEANILEKVALDAASDPRLSSDTRMRMATFVVVRNGSRGDDSSALHEAAELAGSAMNSLDATPFARSMAQQTVYRALAFVPFVAKKASGTWEMLDTALACQFSQHPSGPDEELVWKDHAFPLYQTIARTHLLLGNETDAIVATDQLVELSPNDERTWEIRGQALVASGQLEEAYLAYERMSVIGGLSVGRAAYYMGWISQQLGKREKAMRLYKLSKRVDPTVPAVDKVLSDL